MRAMSGAVAVAILVVGVAVAAEAQAEAVSAPRRPTAVAAAGLGSALASDGSVSALSGSFDARGYSMSLGRDGAPRFTRTSTASAATAVAAAAWSENYGVSAVSNSVQDVRSAASASISGWVRLRRLAA